MKALLYDANLCVGCEACLDACKAEYELPDAAPAGLSADRFNSLEEHGDYYLRRSCMHCLEPACASACPVGALHKTEDGPVVYDFEKCIGCRYGMVACPFHIPRYEWASRMPKVRKCEMCPHRLAEGRPTACAEACEMDATIFGERTELIAEAWRRISEDPENYAHRVYGLEEAGGTSLLVIGPSEVMDAAFDPRVPMEPLPEKTWAVLSRIPTAVGVVGTGLVGLNWIIRRRIELMSGDNDEGEK